MLKPLPALRATLPKGEGFGAINPNLCRGVQHVFNENAISGSGIVNKNMSNGTDELAVLDDGTAGHADVK